MSRQLGTFVTVHDEDAQAYTFGPGDTLPAWAEKAITNPAVWADSASTGDDTDEPVRPPESGKGSGLEAWEAYADALGVEYEYGANRDEIIAAVAEHEATRK
jgi:hypothetical protein